DNGTPLDPTDDTYTFDLTVTGVNTGSGWIADDPNTSSGSYGVSELLGPYPISSGDLTLTITDASDPSCTTTVDISAPDVCSPGCPPADTTFILTETCESSNAGLDTAIFSNQVGCDSVVITETILLPSSFTTIQQTICPGDSVLVNGSWYSEANPSGTDTLVSMNGCDSLVEVSLSFFAAPMVENLSETLCAGEELVINGIVYNQNQPSGQQVIASVVTGCDSVILNIEVVFTDLEILAEIIPPECAGLTGSFSINQITGGTPPYSLSIDGQPFIPIGSLPYTQTGFQSGTFTAQAEDAEGCGWLASFSMPEGPQPTVEIGNELIIALGDSLQLDPIVNFPYDTLIWSPSEVLSCQSCLNPVVTPLNNLTVTLIASNANGCSGSDALRIIVQRDRQIYFPNVFSPNNDGFNDTFFPSVDLSQVVSINTFQIYDRWGELVFQGDNFQPNQPANGWDGTYRGQQMDLGVYVFFAEIEFIGGEVEIFEGDVTLVR
ncbi:MAG: gliding motility-associated C-terminal domain-containing protein, partial [Saprospiraceae bacterium]